MKNTVHLIGRIGQINPFESGMSFSLATNEKYKNKAGELVEETQWHNCKSFGKQAEVIQKHFKVGDVIALDGRIKYREHEGKYYTDIVLDKFYFIHSSRSQEVVQETPLNEDLPF